MGYFNPWGVLIGLVIPFVGVVGGVVVLSQSRALILGLPAVATRRSTCSSRRRCAMRPGSTTGTPCNIASSRALPDQYVGAQVRQQLRGADLIVLNKTDLVGAEERAAVRSWLRKLEPDVRVVEAQHGAVPLPLLLGDRTPDPARYERGVAECNHHHRHDHHHDLAYATWSYTSDAPLAGDSVRAFAAELPEGIVRAKGILQLREAPERRTVFQMVGRRWSLKPDEPWGSEQPRTQLAVIGLPGSVDDNLLETMLRGRGEEVEACDVT